MATHSSILAWQNPWTEEPGGYSPEGHKESDTTEHTSMQAHHGGVTLMASSKPNYLSNISTSYNCHIGD